MKKVLGYIIISIISLFILAFIVGYIIIEPLGFVLWVIALVTGFGIIILLHKAYEWIKEEQDK